MSDSPTFDANAPALIVTGGQQDGHILALERDKDQVVGSGGDVALRLDLANIEAVHARVRWTARGILLSDVGTSTGTYVNGERVEEDYALQDGDRVSLGPPGSKQSAKLLVRVPAGIGAEDDALPLDMPAAGRGEGEPLILDDVSEPPAIVLEERWAPPPTPAARAAPPPAAAAPPLIDLEPALPPTPSPKPPPVLTPAPRAKPAEGRKPTKADYNTDLPSLAALPPRDSGAASPTAPPPPLARPSPKPITPRAAPRRGLSLPPIPRAAIVAVVTAVAAGAGYFAVRSFQKTPPVISSTTPPKVEIGQALTIKGTGFDTDASRNTVRVGDAVAKVVSADETSLVVTVPELDVPSGSAEMSVSVESRSGRSNAMFFKVAAPPRVTAVSPDVAMAGDEVELTGRNLGGKGATVLVGGQSAVPSAASSTSLRFRVPEVQIPLGTAVKVVVQTGAEVSRPMDLVIGKLPLTLGIEPNRVQAGERITVRGRGFDPTPAGNLVSLDGRPALVLTSSPTEIVAVAPGLGGMAQIQAHVMVQVRGTNSSTERSLTVTRPAAAYFRPRYFPAPSVDHPGHEHVFISSELGPALVLSDKADAPSLGERAERLAKALNATMDAAAAGGKVVPSFEVRDKPAAGVGLAGNPALLVAVTAADAAAYDEAWESAPKARHTQAAIAAFWTALLQDHLALFVLHQRPFRVLEVSSRGKVLAEIYTESNRRAGAGVGVPTGVVSPLTTILEKAFREMALVVPGEGHVRAAGAAVEGRWEGTMEESDVGVRGIAVRLRADGANLGGTLKATSGALAMDVPLKDVSYENGTLKFSIMMHGNPKYFVGTVQGETLAGQILSAPSAKDAVGRFTLRFIG